MCRRSATARSCRLRSVIAVLEAAPIDGGPYQKLFGLYLLATSKTATLESSSIG
jgi:hypothetical protein